MIGTLRKHSKWLWFVIIAATVVSFVYWGSQSSRMGGGPSRGANLGSIYGERVTPEQYGDASREAILRYFFNYHEWPGRDAKRTGFDLDRETYFRLMLLKKVKEQNIESSAEAVGLVGSAVIRSINRGNPVPPDVFEKQVLRPQGMTLDDFERFIRHDLELQQFINSMGLAGKLITPQEASDLYRREHEELSIEAAFFGASNYLSGVSVSPEIVSQFYSNYISNYRLPDRIQVSYVRFNVTNFLSDAAQEINKITNLTERVDALYEQRGTNAYRDAKTPEEAKARILKEEERKLAFSKARNKANEFATTLFAMQPAGPRNIETLAKSNDLTVGESAPFDRISGPADLPVGPEFAKNAFEMTSEEPFAGPIPGEDGLYVIALKQTLPNRLQALSEIRDRVEQDCKFELAIQKARAAGEAFYAAATNAMAHGTNFAAICAAQRARPVLLPPLSLSTREMPEVENQVSLSRFKQTAFTTPIGQLSRFNPMEEGGYVLLVRSRLPLDEARMKADMPEFINAVRQARQGEAFNLWFRREADRGLRDTPIARAPMPNIASKSSQ